MANAQDVTRRWIDSSLGRLGPRQQSSLRASNIYSTGRRIYSYGSHFELGRILETEEVPVSGTVHGLAVLNGDRYSVATARHQREVLSAVESAGIAHMIVPFSAAQRAGIDLGTIRAHHVQADVWETIERSARRIEDVPRGERKDYRWHDCDPADLEQCAAWAAAGSVHQFHGGLGKHYVSQNIEPDADGLYRWKAYEHRLGQAVLSAEVRAEREVGTCDDCSYRTRHPHAETEPYTVRRWFVSGFDDQEATPLYFLAELPGRAYDYASALKMLRPARVRAADKRGLEVVRQGDIFGIPAPELTLRKLRRKGADISSRRHLAGTSHTATDVAALPDGTEYARGILRHEPGGWRRAEHRRQRLADGKTWCRIVRNTVPMDMAGNPRAWTIAGRVD